MAYTPPDDARKFTELYSVQRLTSAIGVLLAALTSRRSTLMLRHYLCVTTPKCMSNERCADATIMLEVISVSTGKKHYGRQYRQQDEGE